MTERLTEQDVDLFIDRPDVAGDESIRAMALELKSLRQAEQKSVNAVNWLLENEPYWYGYFKESGLLKTITSILNKFQAEHLTPQSERWVSVKERLPEVSVDVLIHSKNDGFPYCGIGYRDIDGRWFHKTRQLLYVECWMPLPSPPERHES